MRFLNKSTVTFRPNLAPLETEQQTFQSNLSDFHSLYEWAKDNILPLLREITFENADEILKEHKPLVLIFYHPEDSELIKQFKNIIKTQLDFYKSMSKSNPNIMYIIFIIFVFFNYVLEQINFCAADGLRFWPKLQQLGKHRSDLPIILIDNNIYIYQSPAYSDFTQGYPLYKFVKDFYEGRLHRKFYFNLFNNFDEDPQKLIEIFSMSSDDFELHNILNLESQ